MIPDSPKLANTPRENHSIEITAEFVAGQMCTYRREVVESLVQKTYHTMRQ